MASNVFPMLSSSPPPIEDCPDDEDDDDDFGDFASTNIPFDSSFDSPIASEKFKCFKTGENGINDINLKTDLKEFQIFDESESNSSNLPHDFPPHNKNGETDTSPSENCCDHTLSKNNFYIVKDDPNLEENGPLNVSQHKTVTSQNSALHINHCEKLEESKEEDFCEELVINNCSRSERLSESEALECFSTSQKSCDTKSSVLKTSNSLNCCNSVDFPYSCDKIDKNEASYSPPHENGLNFSSSEVHSVNVKLCNDIESLSLRSRSDSNSTNNSDDFYNFQHARSDLNISPKPSVTSVADVSVSNFSVIANSETFTPNFDDFHVSECIQDPSEGSLENCQVHERTHFNDVCKESGNVSDQDEFQAFQNCAGDIGTESEGFAEFQDFKDSQSPESDDFAEFESVSYEQNRIFERTESPEFADFEAVSFQDEKSAEELESSNFADFECASFCSTSERKCSASSIPPSIVQPQDKNIDKLSTVINVIFPLPAEDETVSNESYSEILEQSNKSHRLWEKLHEVEPTPSARFQWGVSQSFQQLLRSVNVDYHSILRTSSVPIFASGLSLLEPVKGLSNSANQEPEDRNQSPRDPIPPVEFDWNSSGLVNPLDSGQAALTLMDLSFLSSAETPTTVSSDDHSFENEFLKPNPTLPQCDNGSKDQILEQLLSKNVCSLPISQASHRPSDLSKEAIHVLDQLRDLSFMQAKVLMFPISSNT